MSLLLLEGLRATSDDRVTMADDNDTTCCAACGKVSDDLKKCDACKLVKYCNRECQATHRRAHKKTCKKRAAELSMSSSLNSHLRMMIALCACCHFHFLVAEEHTNHVVGTSFALAAYVLWRRMSTSITAHFVVLSWIFQGRNF